MKKVLIIATIFLSLNTFAQHKKSSWFLSASSSSLGFTSQSGSERSIDVTFTGFRTDTLVGATDSLNLGFLFPYNYKLIEDKTTELDFSFRTGYFIDKNFQAGLGFGYQSNSTVFKTGPDAAITNASLNDSIMGVWFSSLPDVNTAGQTYADAYYSLYYLIAGSVNNSLTTSVSMINISPFVRYYHTLKNGNNLFLDGSYSIGMGTEETSENLGNTSMTTKLSTTKINFGLGYTINISKNFYVEPQFNYFMADFESELVETVDHPILGSSNLGEQTTSITGKSSGINFSVGLSLYF
jgi:hypothetical protein